ncbi:MAG: cobalamin biosynthesis protein [Burkholderiaceae bacterium]|nr:cobalamin biosynthesis protein [Burkholderiaceae bacterium]
MIDCKVAVGVGCDRHTPLAHLECALQQALSLAGLMHAQIASFASVTAKSDELALLALAQTYAVPLHFYTPAELAEVIVPNPSATVLRYMGTPSVSEAAALLAAGSTAKDLLIEKHKYRGADQKNATISIARIKHD